MTKSITRLYIKLNNIENYISSLDFETKPYPDEFLVIKTTTQYDANLFVCDFNIYFHKYMNELFMKLYENDLKKHNIKEVVFLKQIQNCYDENNEILEYKYNV